MKLTLKYDLLVGIGSDVRNPNITGHKTIPKGSEIEISVARDASTWINCKDIHGRLVDTDRSTLANDHNQSIPRHWTHWF